jgi:uncharacterized heparinase superfamily protein
MFQQAARYFHTARHLKSGQIFWRLIARLKKQVGLPRVPAPPGDLHGRLNNVVAFSSHDIWNSRERICAGHFNFLNRREQIGRPVNWKAPELPLLWQFNLHYFNYLHLLSPEEQIEICTDWVRANPMGTKVGWHPYPTSLRIVNWCKAELDTPQLLTSLYQQAAYLYRNLENYHPGNHLLENARALIFAGHYFEGQGEASRWLRKGLEIYRKETPVQVLKDGGYFERSPMYHAIILEGYLDVINILPSEHSDRPLLIEAARRMSDFLISVTHPDGSIALFNDATREIALPSQALLQYVRELLHYSPEKKYAFNETGYFIHDSQDVHLIIDGGPLGPDFLLAHAHADIFSFELFLNRLPFIVDSGVFEYQAGEMRSYVRSTHAHNTVCVDKVDQAECWSSFRVARRFAPARVSFYRDGTESRFEGCFNGYAKLIGDEIIHQRLVSCDDKAREIFIQDTVTGEGTHLVESLLHLHPDVSVKHQDDRVILQSADAKCLIEANGQIISMEEGWYCPEFGVRQKNKVLVLGGLQSLPFRLSYKISY